MKKKIMMNRKWGRTLGKQGTLFCIFLQAQPNTVQYFLSHFFSSCKKEKLTVEGEDDKFALGN